MVEPRGLYPGPYFDKTPKTVSVQVGTQAYLMCRVKQLDDKLVRAFFVLPAHHCGAFELAPLVYTASWLCLSS